MKTTRYHKHNRPTAGLITVLATAAGLLAAQAENLIVKDMLGDERTIYDSDGDGWDDLWCAIYRDLEHRDKKVDTDGDGITDYDEMLLWRDPFVEGPLPRKATPEELEEAKLKAEEAKQRQALTYAANKERLAPFLHVDMAKADGKPAFRADLNAAKAAAQLQRAADLNLKIQKEKRDAEDFARANGIPLTYQKDGVVGSVERLTKGRLYYNVTHNAGSAALLQTDELWPGGASGLDITGDGSTFGIWDGGDVLLTHQEFGTRITDQDGTSSLGVQAHPSGVSGTMVAAGAIAAARGMSYEAELDTYDWIGDEAEIATAGANGLTASNHSYGVYRGWGDIADWGLGPRAVWWGDIAISTQEDWLFGFYNTAAAETDAIAYGSPEHLQVWAAGNDRDDVQVTNPIYTFNNGQPVGVTGLLPGDGGTAGFDTIADDALAKNVVTVGAVNAALNMAAFSGFGPADDGRVKPDLVAEGVAIYTSYATATNGYNTVDGTSFAAPAVTGSINLIQQQRESYGLSPLLASTLKALAIHTAVDLGNTGPDYQFGWGLMDTLAASDLMAADDAEDSLPHIKEVFLPSGDTVVFVVKAVGGQPLRVKIAWTDPAGTVPADALDPADASLVNDLDLRISDDTITFLPWHLDGSTPASAATQADNTVDNVEQVVVSSPTANGEYTITVSHKGNLVDDLAQVTGQDLSIIIDGNIAATAPALKVEEIVKTGAEEFTLTWPAVVGKRYSVEASSDLQSWTAATGEISAIKEFVASPVSAPSSSPRRFYRVLEIE
jgi:hypothetical protein